MKNRRTAGRLKIEDFPVWTHEQAARAVPYLTSVMNSIRDLSIGLNRQRVRARRLAERPGRPDRNTIIEHDEALCEARRLEEQLHDAMHELACLNVHCVSPVAGLAMIPFVNAEQLAWLVFDLFDEAKISAWRYHHDPLEARRPLSEMNETPFAKTVVA